MPPHIGPGPGPFAPSIPHTALSSCCIPFLTSPCPQPISLTSLASKFSVPLDSPPSFGLSYRGETEAPEAQTSSMAPSKLGGEEETPQPPHLDPVGSPTVLNS